jgi:hypothetical protein
MVKFWELHAEIVDRMTKKTHTKFWTRNVFKNDIRMDGKESGGLLGWNRLRIVPTNGSWFYQ